jgi:hypothetical protein
MTGAGASGDVGHPVPDDHVQPDPDVVGRLEPPARAGGRGSGGSDGRPGAGVSQAPLSVLEPVSATGSGERSELGFPVDRVRRPPTTDEVRCHSGQRGTVAGPAATGHRN